MLDPVLLSLPLGPPEEPGVVCRLTTVCYTETGVMDGAGSCSTTARFPFVLWPPTSRVRQSAVPPGDGKNENIKSTNHNKGQKLGDF